MFSPYIGENVGVIISVRKNQETQKKLKKLNLRNSSKSFFFPGKIIFHQKKKNRKQYWLYVNKCADSFGD